MKIREPAVEGQFYPKDYEELGNLIMSYLNDVEELPDIKNLKAIVVPHAGYPYSGPTAAYGYALLSKFKKDIKKVIILGPTHFSYISDLVADTNEFWETPLGKVKLMKNDFPKDAEPHIQEHSIEVQLPFLQVVLNDFEILPLAAGTVDPLKISEKIRPLLDKDTILIISTDLSHYHEYESCKRLDNVTNQSIEKLDFEMLADCEACGKIPLLSAVDLAKKLGWKVKLLRYQNSGDATGEKGRVVGYSSFAFYKE